MQQENLSRPGPGQCGCDREIFERVWRRVMPHDRPDCPFTLSGEEELSEMEQLLTTGCSQPAAQPAPVQPAGGVCPFPGAPGEEEEEVYDVPCLGSRSAVYGQALQGFIMDELGDMRRYQHLSRRGCGGAGRTLAAMAADELRHARRLSAAYFLISGVWFWPEQAAAPAPAGSYPALLRRSFALEQQGAQRYLAAAEEMEDACLNRLCLELAEEEKQHAATLRALLEQARRP